MPFERLTIRSAALAAAALLLSAPALAADEPYGVWMNDTGRGAIEIKDCNGALCGHVVWVKDTSDVKGCGRQIIGDAVSTGGGIWGGDDAWIYSPEKKKNYNVEITPLSDGTLKVKGYAGVSFLSKTMIWTKAPADLAHCSEQQAAAPAPKAAPEERKEAAAPAPKSESTPEAAAPPAGEQDVAESGEGGDINISDIGDRFSDVFSRKDGKCKLDLPWVKMDFDCKKKAEEEQKE